MGVDPDRVIADRERSIEAGAIAPWPAGSKSWRMKMVETLAEAMRFSLGTAWEDLPEPARQIILYGSGEKELTFKFEGKKSSYKWRGSYEGVVTMLERRYKETDSVVVRAEIEKYMSVHTCPDCKGRRLRPEALAVTVGGRAIDQLSAMAVSDLRALVAGLEFSSRELKIASKVVQEITDRLRFLDDVGVGYL